MEKLLETLKQVPEEYFIKRYKAEETIYLSLNGLVYRLDKQGKTFLDKKNNNSLFYELDTKYICSTKAETIEKFEEYINSQKQLLKEAIKMLLEKKKLSK